MTAECRRCGTELTLDNARLYRGRWVGACRRCENIERRMRDGMSEADAEAMPYNPHRRTGGVEVLVGLSEAAYLDALAAAARARLSVSAWIAELVADTLALERADDGDLMPSDRRHSPSAAP